jgi:AcrR family transcriptional regulator
MEKNSTTVQISQFINKSKSYYTWIKAGYELFAEEGPEGIQIERLARILNLNKSGFYHYFGSHETYFEHLMQYHLHHTSQMADTLKAMHKSMSGFFQLLVDYSIPVLVQKQLQRAHHISLFATTYEEVNNNVDPVILPFWADFIEIPDNPTLALQYLKFVREVLYVRVTPATLTLEFISDFSQEAKEICDGFRNSYSRVAINKKSA